MNTKVEYKCGVEYDICAQNACKSYANCGLTNKVFRQKVNATW